MLKTIVAAMLATAAIGASAQPMMHDRDHQMVGHDHHRAMERHRWEQEQRRMRHHMYHSNGAIVHKEVTMHSDGSKTVRKTVTK